MTAAVLIAADSDEPGQPFLSPDDLASIQPLWTEAVDRHLMPIVGAVWDDSAGAIHAEMLDATDVDFPFPSVGSQAAEAYLAQARNVYDMVGDDLWATARAEMLEGFRLGESVDQIADRLRATAGMTARNAVLVARSTVIEASNAGSIATARASGLEMRKEWIATPDPRTRPTHRRADGQVVDLNATFTVGGFDADFPADPTLPPQEKFRCRCTTGYLLADAVAKEARRDADTPPLPNTSTEPAPQPQPAPVEATPAERRAAARARQKAIAEQEPVADFAAELDQIAWARRDLPFDDDAAKILAQRLQFAVDAGIPEADLAAVRAAVEARDMLRVRAEAQRLAQTRGLAAVDNAGDRVPFDEARHKALVDGTDFADGELVDVHRQGHILQLGDDTIPLDRAQVRAINVDTAPEPPTTAVVSELEEQQSTLAAARAGLARRPSNLTAAQRTALRDYQGTMYYGINGQLRRGQIEKLIQRRIDLIDAAMESSPLDRDVVLWRGTKTGRGMFGDRLDHDLTGVEWLEDAYVSSSASRRVAVDFTYAGTSDAPGLVMRVVVPKGTGAVEVSGVFGQAELLLQRGLRMRVVRDRGIGPDGYRLLDVEVVPAPAAPRLVSLSPEERLRAGIRSGVKTSEPLSGGAVGQVELVTFNDGTRAIRKVAHKEYVGISPEELTDKEQLAAMVGRAIGAPVPAVVRTGAREVFMEYVPDTRSGWKALGRNKAEREANLPSFVDTDDGRLLGLLDQLTHNADRHDGNWLVRKDGGGIVGIDHGLTWLGRQHLAERLRFVPNDIGPFAENYSKYGKWLDNDLSPADIAWAGRQLEALRPAFAEAGRENWLEFSLARLRQIGDHAEGMSPILNQDLAALLALRGTPKAKPRRKGVTR